MDGRHFAGKQVKAHLATGHEKFKKSGGRQADVEDNENEENKRLDQFGEWLEKKADDR